MVNRMDLVRYREERSKFYQNQLNFWPDLYGEEYALYDVHLFEQDEIKHFRLATERIGHLFYKTADLIRHVPDETLLEMGYPKETVTFLRLKPIQMESAIARLDLVYTGASIKCLEINADTPTFIKELFQIGPRLCDHFHLVSPDRWMERRLKNTINQVIWQSAQSIGKRKPYIVFTSHQDHIEDYFTSLYLQELADFPSQFVPLHKLKIIKGEGLFDEEGRKIDILYRQTFPIENLILDQDIVGNDIGVWLLDLVRTGKLAVINPPSAFLLQNKAVQAVIWNLHIEGNSFYTDEEHEWIEAYFLPSYLEPDQLATAGKKFVKKPVFGREGNTVEIYGPNGTKIMEDAGKDYTNYPSLYQEFVELPVREFQSLKGRQQGHYIIGSFLLNGRAGALGIRIGNAITDNLSYFLPVGMGNIDVPLN
ncbi:glutathionylspermidine synthase family protein [Caldibacillus thermoamylovorans]